MQLDIRMLSAIAAPAPGATGKAAATSSPAASLSSLSTVQLEFLAGFDKQVATCVRGALLHAARQSPKADGWVRGEVPASQIELPSGHSAGKASFERSADRIRVVCHVSAITNDDLRERLGPNVDSIKAARRQVYQVLAQLHTREAAGFKSTCVVGNLELLLTVEANLKYGRA